MAFHLSCKTKLVEVDCYCKLIATTIVVVAVVVVAVVAVVVVVVVVAVVVVVKNGNLQLMVISKSTPLPLKKI